MISIIVPTTGRTREVERLFESLTLQQFTNFEVILVDQNMDNRLDGLVDRFGTQLQINHIKDSGFGASHARNVGATYCKGELLLWPDDDSWYPIHLTRIIEEYFLKNTHVDGAIGYLFDENDVPHSRWFSKKKKIAKIMDAFIFGAEPVLCFRKGIFEELQGFDEKIGTGARTPWGAGEGTDLCVRALNSKSTISIIPEFIVFHKNEEVRNFTKNQLIKAQSYAVGMGAVIKKNNLSKSFFLQYGFNYFRAIFWNFLKLNFNATFYHLYRLISLIHGFRKYSE